MRTFVCLWLLLCLGAVPLWAQKPQPAGSKPASSKPAGSKVAFDSAGIALVDGKPFFPVGLFTYALDGTVMAELHEQQFNTVITLHAEHRPDQLDFIHQHGLMALCPTREDWLRAAKDHPALLAWYLSDEPEGHGRSPASERERYHNLKALDPHHPIGLCHFLWEALEKYKDACDFSMTDVYPITANRDVPITHVGKFIDEARRVHGANWPHWAYIQIFGGPDTDGGKWAQPLPHEVRCMTYIALAHRATGILYFSYWPKAPRTWQSIGSLNGEIHRMTPWLVAPGIELPAKSSDEQVRVRARQVGACGIVIAVNTSAAFTDTEIAVPGIKASSVRGLFKQQTVAVAKDRMRDFFAPFEEKVYVWGPEPAVEMARRA